jgi:hypothetical protein
MSRVQAKPRSRNARPKSANFANICSQICVYICGKHQPRTRSHNHTASLLQLAENLGQHLLGKLLDLVGLLLLLLLVALLVALLSLVSLVPLLLARVATVTLLGRMVTSRRGHDGLATGKVYVNATGIVFSRILQAQLLAHLLDTGLDFLDVVGGVVSLADNTRRYFSRTHNLQYCVAVLDFSRLTHANDFAHAAWRT